MTTLRARSKPPKVTRQVSGDDLAIVIDGETYYPHAGESVTFRGRVPFSLWMRLQDMTNFEEGAALLAQQIEGWDFTDDDGNPYPSPPTVDTLLSLPGDEFKWLIQKLAEAESPKN